MLAAPASPSIEQPTRIDLELQRGPVCIKVSWPISIGQAIIARTSRSSLIGRPTDSAIGASAARSLRGTGIAGAPRGAPFSSASAIRARKTCGVRIAGITVSSGAAYPGTGEP